MHHRRTAEQCVLILGSALGYGPIMYLIGILSAEVELPFTVRYCFARLTMTAYSASRKPIFGTAWHP